MASARVRAYDVEPKSTVEHSGLPSWAADFPLDHIPLPGDEMKFDEHWWQVIRRSYIPQPNGMDRRYIEVIVLAVRFVS